MAVSGLARRLHLPNITISHLTTVTTLFSFTSLAKGQSRDGTIGEDTIRASLISAVSDKLRWRMKEEMDRAQAELDALKRTEEDLKKGHQKLEEMVSRLDQEVVRCLFQSVGSLFISVFFLMRSKSNNDPMVSARLRSIETSSCSRERTRS